MALSDYDINFDDDDFADVDSDEGSSSPLNALAQGFNVSPRLTPQVPMGALATQPKAPPPAPKKKPGALNQVVQQPDDNDGPDGFGYEQGKQNFLNYQGTLAQRQPALAAAAAAKQNSIQNAINILSQARAGQSSNLPMLMMAAGLGQSTKGGTFGESLSNGLSQMVPTIQKQREQEMSDATKLGSLGISAADADMQYQKDAAAQIDNYYGNQQKMLTPLQEAERAQQQQEAAQDRLDQQLAATNSRQEKQMAMSLQIAKMRQEGMDERQIASIIANAIKTDVVQNSITERDRERHGKAAPNSLVGTFSAPPPGSSVPSDPNGIGKFFSNSFNPGG